MSKKSRNEFSFKEKISVKKARVNNLKNLTVDIPKNKLVVITGVSGSGKSSLAFDTIYAEAERRFVESLSSYARQFLGIKEKPDADSITGLSPAISIDQKSISKNPRSTVGTITEIYDYMRILFARIGVPFCPVCGEKIGRQSIDEIIKSILNLPKEKEIVILAPLVVQKKGEHHGILEEIKSSGFIRVRINGELKKIDDALEINMDKLKRHSIEVVIDRFELSKDIDRSRIRDSVETALKAGKGLVVAAVAKNAVAKKASESRYDDYLFSEKYACAKCGTNIPEIEPRLFSFNSPFGACPHCTGIGSILEVDPELVLPNKNLSLSEGAIRPWASASHRLGRQSWYWWILDDVAGRYKFSLNSPVENLPRKIIEIILYGEKNIDNASKFEGVVENLKRRWKETDSDFTRAEIEKYMRVKICPFCKGKRLKKEALSVYIGGKNISDLADMTIGDSLRYFNDKFIKNKINLGSSEFKILSALSREIIQRLKFLNEVGLEYLALSRESTTLAGGEAQRIQLATQLGSSLTGVIYVLDEPSIGLHPRDHARLIKTLKELRDIGNSVLVVEHDAETINESDWIIDIGPGAGEHGGKVIFSGTPKDIKKSQSLTGEYLSGKRSIRVEKNKFTSKTENGSLEIINAHEHNLKGINVKIPLGKFVCVSGVSGSGKSTLVNDILAKTLLNKFYGTHVFPGKHDKIIGTENLDKVIVVDQSPIGRTPRSNPATYTGAFGHIRNLFSKTPESQLRGYGPGRFSFNIKGGRCETCEGQGVKKIEMYFLPDVFIPCEECGGKRYNKEVLEIEYGTKNIAEVLDMYIEEALVFFKAIPQIQTKLSSLKDVGLGYMRVGQPAPTLSGGEAQRVKLATELSRRDTGKTLYILDEPTTGLHFDDIQKLLKVLVALVDKGNSILVIEHNLDILKNADWIIDLGPDGGEKGGRLVGEGTPKDLSNNVNSYTGKWLKK